ncbi:hypothetical protein CYY_004609 [Polysphondylium violaceum]|uniref:Uncharacterized protein n=1 Tax=Polysphondylium violaceum TaxID=133409 RepID=A0A8J4PV08_9MYCE|nr:hypothetical protein CYY_004609 [Polysphondylium violaceum]
MDMDIDKSNIKKSNKDLLLLEKSSQTDKSPFLIDNDNKNNNNNSSSTTNRVKPTFSRLPESSLLSRVKDFLPKLKEANIDLQKRMDNNEDVSIEKVKKGEEHIQMNLALGVLEQKEGVTEENIVLNNTNKKKSIVELDKEEQEKETRKDKKTNNDNNEQQQQANNILEFLNTPSNVMDKFGLILENEDDDQDSDDDGFNNDDNERLEPIEIKY